MRWVSGGMAATANAVGALLDGLDPVVFGVAEANGSPPRLTNRVVPRPEAVTGRDTERQLE